MFHHINLTLLPGTDRKKKNNILEENFRHVNTVRLHSVQCTHTHRAIIRYFNTSKPLPASRSPSAPVQVCVCTTLKGNGERTRQERQGRKKLTK